MIKFIISRGEYVVHNIIIEAADEDASEAAAKENPIDDGRWCECVSLSLDAS